MVNKFLSVEPTNRQAQELQHYIKDKMKKGLYIESVTAINYVLLMTE